MVRDLLRKDRLAERITALETRFDQKEAETEKHYATKNYADNAVKNRAKSVKEDAKWVIRLFVFVGASIVTAMLAVLGLIVNLLLKG